MDFFDDFNCLDAATILSRVELAVAADGRSYICPNCGHGKHGDGIKPRVTSKGQTRWKCFDCDTDFSNLDLCSAVFGYNDVAEAARELKALFGLDDDEQLSFPQRSKSARGKNFSGSVDGVIKLQGLNEAAAEPRNFAALYDFCRRKWSLRKFVDEQGGKWRGLTYETLDKAGCVYHDAYKFRGEERPAVIFPYSERFYFARSTVDKERAVPKYAKRELYIAAPIVTDGVNFVSEAEIDALSIRQSVAGCGSVAAGGTSGARLLVAELNKRFGNAEQKPRFIVFLDGDESGKKNAPEFVKALRAAGYPAVLSFPKENTSEVSQFLNLETGEVVTKGKDANDLLVSGELAARLLDIIEQTDDELNEVAAELVSEPVTVTEPVNSTETNAPAQVDATDDGTSFGRSIGEYFAKQFSADVALFSRYAERRTGFDNLDEKLVFVPGLYLLGGLPSTGKTTFGWQLVEQLAERGEHCIFCSYEMSRLELFTKSLARKLYLQDAARSERMGLTSFNIRRGMVTHLDEVQAAVKSLSSSTVNLRVAELSNLPVAKLFERLKPIVAKADKSPVIVLDYLQILPAAPDDKRSGIDDTLRRLKTFQRSTASTFVVISSFNRANYWSPVSFESFKESGAIEYSADAVLGLETCVKLDTKSDTPDERKKAVAAEYKKAVRTVKLTCLKNRNGAAFDCVFDYHCKFDCFEPTIDEDELPPERDDFVNVH